MIKRIFCMVLALLLAALPLSAGAEQTVSAPAEGIPAVLTFLSRGERVQTAGSYGSDYTVVSTSAGFGVIRSEYLLADGETADTVRQGTAARDTALYAAPGLTGEPLREIPSGSGVAVLARLTGCLYVLYDGVMGYMASADVSYWSGFAGTLPSSTGQNGADIPMAYMGGGSVSLLAAVGQNGTVTGSASVRVDQAPVLLGFYSLGEAVSVQDYSDEAGYVSVKLNGLTAHVREDYLADNAAVSYTGYAAGSVTVYAAADLYGTAAGQLSPNAPVTVTAAFADSLYIVSGSVSGYVDRTEILSAPAYPDSTSGAWSEPIL